ncbi:protein of unknown function [Cryobacterium psychrotolerans]|uniref:DUF4349 domain-containing protein n=1 Tax=Cryobacterium psychrotolerans TaxID=386301 RepID=A0A1G9A9E1_9MICO|nr:MULTISPECIES: DUF4349 domain-containing protein [Cryobacterium]TFD49064.1 DUF4349 domain-containing protein [Cryobacterium sp. TMT1-2-1]TFD89745.1 DUF4349 domain-containing protein [Cryobacterium psychrotolerans]SDK23927.1 protein of unknown function [Cryobacterium psychrotolerans]
MKRTLAATAIVLAALILSGCTSSGSSDSSGPPVSDGGVTDGGGVTGEPAPDKGVTGGGEVVTDNRDVITTGTVSLTVKDPIEAAQTAADITEKAGGRVDSRTENPSVDDQPASANLVLRIPADELDNAVVELKKLGTVNRVSLNSTDITQQTQDIEARITSLQTSVDRLLSLMAKATDATDLIAIESALSQRQSELEGLQAQRDYLADQVDFSTISLELYSEGTVDPPNPDNFWDGLLAGWNALMSALGGALVAIGFLLPWLAVLGAIGAVVLLIVWLSTRKRKAA